MPKVKTVNLRYDDELAEQNKIRVHRLEPDVLDTRVLVYREVVIHNSPPLFSKTPWWRQKNH